MIQLVFLFVALVGGALAGLQGAMNADLSRRIGPIEASFVTFAGGALILGLLTVLFGTGQLHRLTDAPRWQLTGGIMGVIIMAGLIASIGRLGAAPAIMASIVGQILLGMTVDHFGLLGVTRSPFGWPRALGVALMVAALGLIFSRAEAASRAS